MTNLLDVTLFVEWGKEGKKRGGLKLLCLYFQQAPAAISGVAKRGGGRGGGEGGKKEQLIRIKR